MTAHLWIFCLHKSLSRGLKMHAFLFAFLVSALIISSSMSAEGYNVCIEHCLQCPHNRTEEEQDKVCGDRGAHIDACTCCPDCAKLEGETCFGAYGLAAGYCHKDLKCTVPLEFVEDGKNITGTCRRELVCV